MLVQQPEIITIDVKQRLKDGIKEQHAFIKERQEIVYHDWTLGLSWAKSDYNMLWKKYYNDITAFDKKRDYPNKHRVILEFENQIERWINDQTSELEPIDFTFKYDKVVNGGRTRASSLITGESVSTFRYYAVGTSTIQTFDGDFELRAEIDGGRINLKAQGFASGPGALIKHNGIWSPGLISVTIWESGQFDWPTNSPSEQTMWSRSVFPSNKPLNHSQNEDFFTITHTVSTTSSS